MSATMNGHAMSIGYGEASPVGSILSIGERYCQSHLPQIPRLTRQQMIRLGCVFPAQSEAVKLTEADYRNKDGKSYPRRAITAQERAEVVALYAAGNDANEIGKRLKRWPVVIRKILREAGIDLRARAVVSKRAKALAMLAAGEQPHDVAWKLGIPRTTAITYKSEVRKEAA